MHKTEGALIRPAPLSDTIIKIKKFSFSLHAGFIAICEFVHKVC